MSKKAKAKKKFFDLHFFGVEFTPITGIIVGLILAVLFYGNMVGTIGFVVFVIGLVKLLNDLYYKHKGGKYLSLPRY